MSTFLFIALSILYAFLTTPIFPYVIFKKVNNLRGDYIDGERPHLIDRLLFIIIAVGLAIISFFASESIYDYYYPDLHWYVYLFPLIVPALFQLLYAALAMVRKNILKVTIIVLALVSIFSVALPLRDKYLPFMYSSNKVSSSEMIMETFDSYYDDKTRSDIYLVDTKNGYGIIQSSPEKAAFYPFRCRADVERIQKIYGEKVVYLEFELDGENGFAYFATLKRKGLFERPVIKEKLQLNLSNGEIKKVSD